MICDKCKIRKAKWLCEKCGTALCNKCAEFLLESKPNKNKEVEK